ncbi:hypothetical protein BGS_0040 [Beggiatoa sp. SS]|nr:hypothetical protein BGS_0040 [Beggiatoa sp. SS]
MEGPNPFLKNLALPGKRRRIAGKFLKEVVGTFTIFSQCRP